MRTTIDFADGPGTIDLSRPLDISVEVGPSEGPLAWYVRRMSIEPVRTERFTGSVAEGGAVNFRDLAFNPHGNCTHTECVGHIDQEVTSVANVLDRYFFKCQLISVQPTAPEAEGKWTSTEDRIITRSALEIALEGIEKVESLVIRTLPNDPQKIALDYSNTNPPYITPDAMSFLLEKGVDHLLVDIPSVDREEDGGKLVSHHVFWEHPHNTNRKRTITELVFVDDHIADGEYVLNLQTVPIINDAVPSRPVLYEMVSA